MSELLEIDDVYAEIANIPVLRGVSASVDSGESVALLGPNGAGKTSTFATVTGTIPVTKGTVRMRGEDITSLPAHKRAEKGLGISPEDRRLFTDLTVRDNLQIAMWGSRRADSEAAVEEAIDRVTDIFPYVEKFIDRKARQLSGGQQQMVAVGRAIAADADVIMLDEPFEGLAPSVRKRFRAGIERLNDLDTSLLIAESNVRHAQQVADRFYVLDRGEIVTVIESAAEVEDDPEIERIFTG
jgi:branched-chain amino acid transport system ATP-binding protein